MLKRSTVFLVTLLTMIALVMPAMAQDNAEVIADGLSNPRNLVIMEDGTIYVAEAGIGGDLLNANDSVFGATSQISMITPDGEVDTIVRGLVSTTSGNSTGAFDIAVVGDSLWFVVGETGDESFPFSSALVELNMEHMRVQTFVDLLTAELELDPDGNPNGQSNPTDMEVLADGSVLIANAGCNCLMQWSPDAGVTVPVVWEHADDNPVPTSIVVTDNGDIYVGFLTGFPFPTEGSRIEHWSGGELVETFDGLTAVTGLAVTDDGRIFATEFGMFEMGAGWSEGRVVEVTSEGVTPVLEGLVQPFGLEVGPDGRLYVSNNTTGGADGQILAISIDE